MTDGITGTPVLAGARRGAAWLSTLLPTWLPVLLTGLAVGMASASAASARDTSPAPAPHVIAPRAVSGIAVAEPEAGTLAVTPVVTAVPALPLAHRFGIAVPDGGLARQRGGAALPASEMKLDGAVGNNVATNVATGANVISDGAFSNASGLPMVIQNSGANVLIQNATIVNVQFE